MSGFTRTLKEIRTISDGGVTVVELVHKVTRVVRRPIYTQNAWGRPSAVLVEPYDDEEVERIPAPTHDDYMRILDGAERLLKGGDS